MKHWRVVTVVIMRENVHGHGSRNPVVSIPEGLKARFRALDPDCFHTIATACTLVPGRRYSTTGNEPRLL